MNHPEARSTLAGQRVLVTGGAGFIGSHVVERLLTEGAQVTVLDDLSTGRATNVPTDERVRLVVGDAADGDVVQRAIEGCSRIVHLAAVASVQRSVEDPLGTHRANLVSTLQVLEASRRARVARVVYASSAAVYGDARTPPIGEEGVLDPRTPYAIDKLAGEQFLAHYRRAHGLPTIALRFFNVYGPRQLPDSPYSGVISLFVDRVARSAPVTIYGDGRQTRDFVEVGDVVGAIVRSLALEPVPSPFVMNVGTGVATSVLDLLALIEHVSGHRVERRFDEPRQGDVRASVAGVVPLRAVLGDWAPRSLERGLHRLLDEHGVPSPVEGLHDHA